jgi:hypothetical protein
MLKKLEIVSQDKEYFYCRNCEPATGYNGIFRVGRNGDQAVNFSIERNYCGCPVALVVR